MIRHNFILDKLVDSFQSLVGCKLVDCFSQEKSAVTFVFFDGDKELFLQYFSDPNTCSVFLRRNFARAKKNSTDMFPGLVDDTLQSVEILASDRIIKFSFISSCMYLLLFGGPNSNIYCTNRRDRIFDALESRKELFRTAFVHKPQELKSLEDFPEGTPVHKALARSGYQLGAHYAKECLNRLDIDISTHLELLSPEQLSSIDREAKNIKRECINSTEYLILKDAEENYVLSQIPLSKFPEVLQVFDDINEAVHRRVTTFIKDNSFAKYFKTKQKKIDTLIHKLRNSIEKTSDVEKTKDKIQKRQKWAELLISQTNPKIKSGESIVLTDWDGNAIEIVLDPKLNLFQNSDVFFKKIRAAKKDLVIREKRLPKLKKDLEELELIKREFDAITSVKELDKYCNKYPKQFGIMMVDKNKVAVDKYKVFELGNNFTFYVGKNAANNDELTMRFAKANDLWFHARGCSGSHAVLRLEKGQKAPKEIIEKCGEIVAYYSKARKAKYTPVVYTFKKYVRKPKGANVGAVVLAKEQVIMVSPRLPEGEEE